VLWVILVLDDLSVLIVGIPGFYNVLHVVCPTALFCTTISDQLTTQTLVVLQRAGISVHTYALYVFIWDMLTSLVFLLVGSVIFWRRANTWMGLFVSFFLINLGSVGLSLVHVDGAPAPPDFLSMLWIPLQILEYLCLAFFLFTFPDGRLVPRWSWALISIWIVNTFVWVVPQDTPLNINNWSPLLMACWLFVVFGASVSTQLYRYLRVASPIQRQQIKWLIYGFTPVLLVPICAALFLMIFPSPFLQVITEPLYRFYYLPIPICIGIALLRYRLWDIDVLINRTLVYGLLTTALLVVYFALVFTGESLVTNVLGHDNGAVLVVSTLIVAALFRPFRRYIQQIIDRRFYRRKYDAARTLEAFSAPLRNEVDLATLSEHLITVVQETMQPTHVSLWVRPKDEQRRQASTDATAVL
jgi:hypothetical protein